MASLRTVDAAGLGLAALAGAAGVALRPDLPAEMAIHFDASGTPDSYVPRAVGVAFLPALMVGLLAFMNAVARVKPPSSRRVFDVAKLWTVGVLAFVHGFVLAWNLGHELPPTLVLAAVLGSAAVLVGWSLLVERGHVAG